jgi:hypothetical protein
MSSIASFRVIASVLVAALLVAAPASTSPITYDESVDGDLTSPFNAPLKLLLFDSGINTVSGRLGVSGDFDSFAFSIPIGLGLVSASVELVDVAGDVEGVGWFFRRGQIEWNHGQFLQTVAADSPGTTELLVPQPDGLFTLSQFAIQYSTPEGVADYRFTFDVGELPVPVPEPEIVALMSIGLTGLKIVRRRRDFKTARRRACGSLE